MKRMFFLLIMAVLILSAHPSPPIQDWSSCEYDLDRVRRAARDASYTAADVHSKASELEHCINDPEAYDLLGTACRSYRWEYESAKDQLWSELDTLNSRLRSVQYSCNFQFALGPTTPGTPIDPVCEQLKRYKGRLSDVQLLAVCKAQRSEEYCKKCLGIK